MGSEEKNTQSDMGTEMGSEVEKRQSEIGKKMGSEAINETLAFKGLGSFLSRVFLEQQNPAYCAHAHLSAPAGTYP
eukprot:437390-Pelagomonas_calceolata.AAC.1